MTDTREAFKAWWHEIAVTTGLLVALIVIKTIREFK